MARPARPARPTLVPARPARPTLVRALAELHGDDAAIAVLLERYDCGIAAYGVPLSMDVQIDALDYAIEEAADLLLYATLALERGEPWALEETAHVRYTLCRLVGVRAARTSDA